MNLSRSSLEALLEKTAGRMASLQNGGFQEECPVGISDFNRWEWPQGVGLYGLFKHYQASGKTACLQSIRDWYARRFAERPPEKNVNTTAPMLTLAHLCALEDRPGDLAMCAEWADWIMTKMPRTRDRGLQHIVSGQANEQQLWADTLYMTVLFLAKMGKIMGRQDYIDEAVHQFLVHIKYLFDKRTGLWFHGWTFDGNHNFANALWARGNCWVTAGTVDFVEMVGLPAAVLQYLIDTVTAQVEALARLQSPSGMWHTLLEDSTSYVESSATAGFGYGILKGVRCGYLDKKFLPVGEKALAAVIDRISDDGTVQQVSYGTGMGHTLRHYHEIPLSPMAYGQALAVLLLTEGIALSS